MHASTSHVFEIIGDLRGNSDLDSQKKRLNKASKMWYNIHTCVGEMLVASHDLYQRTQETYQNARRTPNGSPFRTD